MKFTEKGLENIQAFECFLLLTLPFTIIPIIALLDIHQQVTATIIGVVFFATVLTHLVYAIALGPKESEDGVHQEV